jgi:hypothetical protein
MLMCFAELRRNLIAAIRLNLRGGQAHCAVDKRIIGLIAARSLADCWLFWTRGVWRAAASCVAVTLIRGGVSSMLTPASSDVGDDLPAHFENTLHAPLIRGDVTP